MWSMMLENTLLLPLELHRVISPFIPHGNSIQQLYNQLQEGKQLPLMWTLRHNT